MKKHWQVWIITIWAPIALSGCMSPVTWWSNVHTKAKHLRDVHVKYSALSKEHKDLKKRYLELEHKHHHLQNKVELTRREAENHRITGDAEGRHVANLPRKLKPGKQVDAPIDVQSLSLAERTKLALKHTSNDKFHRAFVLFESVLSSPEGAAYQTPTMFYQAGVSAYKIRNWKRAREYFEAANSHAHSFKDFEVVRRTDLWLKILNRTQARVPASMEALPEAVKKPYGGAKASKGRH